jgi:hypothetical protein
MEENLMSVIKVKLSKIQFPEFCPVCLEEAEDLVFVTVAERARDDYEARSWGTVRDKTQIALDAASGATTFSVPTCMRHGSRSVRSFRSKVIAVIGFFIIFYPILYFLLSINSALASSRELTQPLTGLLATFSVLVAFLLYGFFPRALERALRFHEVSRVKDTVFLSISKPEYRSQFLELNEMHSDVVNEPTENTE